MKKHIPNLITCLNIVCGFFAIQKVLLPEPDFITASYLVIFSLIFDFLDGAVARALNVKSEMGKELDSLADMVTFGVLPGMVMYKLLEIAYVDMPESYIPFVAVLIPVFSGLRLAKFNIDTRQTESFIGLNTPANTILIMSLAFIYANNIDCGCYKDIIDFILNPYLLIGVTLFSSYLLVSELPMFSLKNVAKGWSKNKVLYPFIILSVGLVVFIGYFAIPIIIILYILVSFFVFLFNGK